MARSPWAWTPICQPSGVGPDDRRPERPPPTDQYSEPVNSPFGPYGVVNAAVPPVSAPSA